MASDFFQVKLDNIRIYYSKNIIDIASYIYIIKRKGEAMKIP